MTLGQLIAEQTARYCNAMAAYEARELSLSALPREALKNYLIGTAKGDQEYMAGVETMGREALIAAIVEFECGGAVEEAAQLLKKVCDIDVSGLESVRKFGTTYPVIANKHFYTFFVTPDDKPPAEELTKLFESGSLTRLEKEESEDNDGKQYLEWHMSELTLIDIVKIVNFFALKFVSMDNSAYINSPEIEMGDLVYQNNAGVRFEIFNMEGWAIPFTTWAPELKEALDKACNLEQ